MSRVDIDRDTYHINKYTYMYICTIQNDVKTTLRSLRYIFYAFYQTVAHRNTLKYFVFDCVYIETILYINARVRKYADKFAQVRIK